MRIKILFTVVLMSIMLTNMHAQFKIHSVGFFGDYSTVLSKKSELKVNSMNGPGGELEVKFDLYKNLQLTINTGYKNISVDQEVHALFAQWNWKAWKRYYGDINDTNLANFKNKYVQLLLTDTANYSAVFTPVQKMEVFPLIATFNYNFEPIENISIQPSMGFGVIFFYKSLYVEEHWKKFFNQLGGYVFDYSYRNMAEKISGNPYVITAGLEADYRIGEFILVSGGARYTYLLNTGNKYGYNDFTSKDLLNLRLGLTFEY